MAEDISRNTLFVLVILTLLISVLGTWTVISQINAVPSTHQATSQSGSGEVSFSLAPPPPPATDGATGRVAFQLSKSK